MNPRIKLPKQDLYSTIKSGNLARLAVNLRQILELF